ncbi:MAG TPA: biotin/lipoyl-binding protein, partial [Bacteroides sp.]|nr:biotin/lipoyl-binding protein [Bacteroides sp.]
MPSERSSGKVELQPQEIEDMLGKVPGWLTRNGIILFLFLLALLIFGSWVFRYPDIKRASIVVTSVNPPADLEARSSGKITKLFISDNDLVSAGTVLAMIENPAAFEDVMQLKEGLAFLDSVPVEQVTGEVPELKNARLGTIQSDYSIFLKAYRDYLEFKRIDYHQRKIELLRSELDKKQAYTRSLTERARIQEEAYNLALRQFNRDATLYEQGVLSQSDLEKSRSAMLQERNQWQEIVSLMAEN